MRAPTEYRHLPVYLFQWYEGRQPTPAASLSLSLAFSHPLPLTIYASANLKSYRAY